MNKMELFILNWVGRILQIIAICGFIFTIFFDKLAGRVEYQVGVLELTGMICCITLAIFGFVVEIFLLQIKDMMIKYLEK